MTVTSAVLLADLRKEVRRLEIDIRSRAESDSDVAAQLREDHRRAVQVGRTATAFTAWLDDEVTQAAVAWVLGTVFVRFCEDNGLVSEPWITGPGDRASLAVDRQRSYFLEHPHETDREWLNASFAHLASHPAAAALFERRHNPLFKLKVSGDAATGLLEFWRRTESDGALVHDLQDQDLSTRFLGDLYQDLSESARKKYALLQTPDFVEELILDLTLEHAIDDFGLDGLRMIDPTCGSGHFLLGAFQRLLDRWGRDRPGVDARERVQSALDSVHGVDVNPFATAISKFRLTVEAMRASNVRTLAQAPGYRLHIATGDSLLWEQGGLAEELPGLNEGDGLADHQYGAEDLSEHPGILRPGSYHAVVGNPPYITVKDKALNEAYRKAYSTCSGKYALSVPFAELFFRLTLSDRDRPGYTGQITSNSFMKREFGKKLVEQFFTSRDLSHVIDTSGAYIPGHGTPTVILVGRNRYAKRTNLRAVLGIRGEPGAPQVPAEGSVWRSIVDHLEEPGFENDFVSVSDLPRERLAAHPWSLSGGGADELLALLDTGSRLSEVSDSIGITSFTLEDDVYVRPRRSWERLGIREVRPMCLGDGIRDFVLDTPDYALFPYDGRRFRVFDELDERSSEFRGLWPFRTNLSRSMMFGGRTKVESGLKWYEYGRLTASKLKNPFSITFAFVATHNHFVFDRGGKVFKQSAPVIKLPAGASEDDHLGLLGVLNSSTACFWLKQVCHNKGEGGGARVDAGYSAMGSEAWKDTYEFTGTKLQEFPLPSTLPIDAGSKLDELQRERSVYAPEATARVTVPSRNEMEAAANAYSTATKVMVFWQEELDWETYTLYGLMQEDLNYTGEPVEVALGERAFEIHLARKVAAGEAETVWFERHRSVQITEVPAHWPADYRDLVERRLVALQQAPLTLIERPECKRRWAGPTWEQMQAEALRDWLLARVEDRVHWFDGAGRPRIRTTAQLADDLRADADFTSVLGLWAGVVDVDVAAALAKLVSEEHVPYLAAWRYKETGMRTRQAWEETWALQRREDEGEKLDVPVPPKYKPADFLKTSYWRQRGKLDVPKERFISFPGAERGADASLVLGWAGWDHAEQALALAGYALDRQRTDGWDAERLLPLWAGVAELEPWVRQWHSDVDVRMGSSPADAVTGTLEQALSGLQVTRSDLTAWRPPAPTRGRRAARPKETTP